MSYALIAILFLLWLLGIMTSHLFGGFLHLLLGVAISLLLRVIAGKPAVQDAVE
jgi:hypothetical protein